MLRINYLYNIKSQLRQCIELCTLSTHRFNIINVENTQKREEVRFLRKKICENEVFLAVIIIESALLCRRAGGLANVNRIGERIRSRV